ncbi:MAG TPA: DUF2512 family protein [Firmicutes bacterium]|jgi:hypothetical protein|nr:DUF2512 family protein [Bacillota bacterium]
MSNTTTALLVKLIMTFIFAMIAFGYVDKNMWSSIFWVALAGTVINYLVGDLLVLPSLGNIIASIGDGAMGALTAYIVSMLLPAFQVSMTGLFLFGILVAIGEYFFHQYLRSAEKVAP